MITNRDIAATIALYHHGIIPAPIPYEVMAKIDILPPFVNAVLSTFKHISRVWNTVSKEYRDKIQAVFAPTKQGKPPDPARVTKVIHGDHAMRQEIMDLVPPKAQTIFSDLSRKAIYAQLLDTRMVVTEDFKRRIDTILSLRSADQIAEFVAKYPDRFIHPEIERLVRLSEKAYRDGRIPGNVVDTIQAKLWNVTEGDFCRDYMTGLSNVHAARIWSGSGIALYREQNITEYMSVSMGDKNVCPVCKSLEGHVMKTEVAYEKLERSLLVTDVEEMKQVFPFPRIKDIKDLSPKEIKRMGFLPPYHPICRCQIVPVWSSK